MELMVVVAIIGVSMAIIGPAAHGAIAERKNGEAALDLVRLARRTRAEAVGYGRAHLIRWSSAAGGSFTVYRGVTSNCNANDWAAIIASGLCGAGASMCIDQLALNDTNFILGSTTISAVESTGAATRDICYEPSGIMKHRIGVAVFSDRNVGINGGIRFNFIRRDGGSPTGVMRSVVLPLGGDARVFR